MRIIVCLISIFVTGCQMQANNSTANDALLYGNQTVTAGSDSNFPAAQAVLKQNCASCHEHTEWASYSETDYLNNGYVSRGNLAGSAIWTNLSVNGGGMPQGGSLSSAQVTAIQTWIVGMNAPGSTTVQTPSFLRTQAAMQVLSANCVSCHNVTRTSTTNGSTVPAFAAAVAAFLANGDDLTANQYFVGGVNNLVVEGNATQSWLYEALNGYGSISSMPKTGTSPNYTTGTPLDATDAQTIADWINGIGQ